MVPKNTTKQTTSSAHSMVATKATEEYYNKKATTMQYQVDQLVWLQEHNFLHRNKKLAPQWTGPYNILKVFDFGVVDIEYKGKRYRVNTQQIKPYISNERQTQQTTVQPSQLQPQQQQHQSQTAPQPRQEMTPFLCTQTTTQTENSQHSQDNWRGRKCSKLFP